jgi:uncharacterized membrane protein
MEDSNMTARYISKPWLGCLIIVALGILAVGCSKKDKPKPTNSSSTAAHDSMTTVAVSYRAFGNEPFWSLTINSKELRFSSPEDSAGVSFPAVAPVANGDTLRWTSKNEKGRIVVLIWRGGTCSDGMSNKVWTHSSNVKLNDTSYMGCAEASSQPLR